MAEYREHDTIINTQVDLGEVPNWHYKPVSLLWPLPRKPSNVMVKNTGQGVNVPQDVQRLRDLIPVTPTSFPGPLANTDAVTFTENGGIEITSSETDFFAYKAASYYFREQQGENPVRPLSVQATLVTPDGKIIAERRPLNLEDFPGTLSVFGGSINPEGAKDPKETLRTMLGKKQGLTLKPDQLELTGIGRDNISNVFTIFYIVKLNEEQAEELLETFSKERQKGEKVFYVVSANSGLGYIERLLQHRDVSRWNPLGYANLLYALTYTGFRSKEEIEELFAKTGKLEKPLEYIYPIEQHLNNPTKDEK